MKGFLVSCHCRLHWSLRYAFATYSTGYARRTPHDTILHLLDADHFLLIFQLPVQGEKPEMLFANRVSSAPGYDDPLMLTLRLVVYH
jgi:hypothetical protein